jgi:hypothetical protein
VAPTDDEIGAEASKPPYWSRCEFAVMAKSHYKDDGSCRCGDEQWASVRNERVPSPGLPAPLKYTRWEVEHDPPSDRINELAREWGYYSWDAELLEGPASDWLWEAQEAGNLPHHLRSAAVVHSWVMQRVKAVLATTDDIEVVRACLAEIVDDLKRYRVAEHQLTDEREGTGAGAWWSGQMHVQDLPPWLPGPQWRTIARILRSADRDKKLTKKAGPAAPPPPTRRQLEKRVAELEAEVKRLRGEAG